MPKVSIVLPTYNGERFMRESIESVISQTFTDWELIIVDDCSTDDTLQIALEYAGKEKRIRVIHNEENQKLPEALNIGFRYTSGQYLTWTSDDNVYLSHALEKMNQYLDTHKNMPMVCTGMLLMNENMQYMREYEPYNPIQMYVHNVVGACFMYRREVLVNVGEYSKDFFCVEDYEYWIRIIQRYGAMGFIPDIYYLYRMQGNSLTVKHAGWVHCMNSKLYCKYFDWIMEGIRDNPILIMYLYSYLLEEKCMDQEKREHFEELIPKLEGERALDNKKCIIIFGAGQNGETAYKFLENRIIAFVDSNPLKCGRQKYSVPIWNLEELKNNYNENEHQILISVRAELQLEVIDALAEIGIAQYAIYARICE